MSSKSIVIIDSNFDMTQGGNAYYNYYVIDNLSSNITITLPSGSEGSFYEFCRKDQSANTLTFEAQSGETINGNNTLTLSANQYIHIIYYGTNWISPKFSFSI